jgi:hypothetical protein
MKKIAGLSHKRCFPASNEDELLEIVFYTQGAGKPMRREIAEVRDEDVVIESNSARGRKCSGGLDHRY